MNFNSTTADFSALVKIDTSISLPTEIHASITQRFDQTIWYPNGVDVTYSTNSEVDPEATVSIKDNVIQITIGNPKFDG